MSPASARPLPRRRGALARTLVLVVLLLALVAVQAVPAAADPAPADGPERAADLAGGWLARQVTADGRIVGVEEASDLVAGAWTALGLLAAGEGRTALLRAAAALVRSLDARGPADLGVDELALLALVLSTVGGDPTAVGEGQVDLLQALLDRVQATAPDGGRIGASAQVDVPVLEHSLALLALAAAGRGVPQASRRWLAEQQCPSGGWPTYRDPAARSTGTCELLPTTTTPTALAVMAASAIGLGPLDDALGWLRGAQDASGGFGPAPGLAPTPEHTALAVLAIRALIGAAPDTSWEGAAGTPQEVLRLEQLGCGWHGGDRGGVPPAALDTVDPPPEQPSGQDPGVAARPRAAALAAIALSGRTLPFTAAAPDVGDPFPGCPVSVVRAGGDGRVGTAVALSRQAFPDGAPAAVVATARAYADALAATALAGVLGGPVLLSESDRAPSALLEEVGRLGAGEVVLMGGEQALSADVATQLASVDGVGGVRRVAGPTRFETAAAAAEEVGGQRAFLVRGVGPEEQAPWADALSVGAWAAASGIPVLLTPAEALPAVTADALEDRAVTIVGGPAAVSEGVADMAAQRATSVRRLGGDTRVATSAMVMREAFSDGVDARTVVLATSTAFPDGLSAGAAAAALGGTLLLVHPRTGVTDPAAEEALLGVDHMVDRLVLSGGPAVLPDGIGGAAADLVRQGING